MKKTFQTTIVRDGSMCFIPVPFDPKPVFGKVRAPVKVTVGKHTYRSTIASMGDGPCIPLRRSNREAAGLEGGETLKVTLELDDGETLAASIERSRPCARSLRRNATCSIPGSFTLTGKPRPPVTLSRASGRAGDGRGPLPPHHPGNVQGHG